MLQTLFENIKVYGRYVRLNKFDGLEYWNRIKNFIQRPEQKIGLDMLNEILGKEWDIEVKINSNLVSDINEIYEYVHGNDDAQLKILGEEEDAKSLDSKVWEQNHFFLQLIRIPKNNDLSLLRLLQIAYNLGQLSTCLKKKWAFDDAAIEYFESNNLNNMESYIKIESDANKKIESEIQIMHLIENIEKYILDQMRQIQSGNGNDFEPFYSENIEKLTIDNNDYRRVIYTGSNQQFVLMSIKPGDNIDMEVHSNNDQFIKIQQGKGKAIVGSITYNLSKNTGIIVPAGMKHTISNTSDNELLKLYTIYSPPSEPDKIIQKSNPNKSLNELHSLEINNEKLNNEKLNNKSIVGLNLDNDEKNYKNKYLNYKNKYLSLKKFMNKYY